MIMGAWAVDMDGNAKVFKDLLSVRVGGSALHLTDKNKVRTHALSGFWF
jgi:hypothetical protein